MSPLSSVLTRSSYNLGELISCFKTDDGLKADASSIVDVDS